MTSADLPNFRDYCEQACVTLWGNPTQRDRKELRWNGHDAYSAKTFSFKKKAWYDHGAGWGGSTLDLVAHEKGQKPEKLCGVEFFDTWRAAHAMGLVPDPPPEKRGNGAGGAILATYPYVDESGALIFEVVRRDATDPDDRFRQRRPDGNGGWIWDTKGIRAHVLYRLPALIGALKAGQRVLITEGERDCNTAVALGFAATTMPGGVSKWRSEYDHFFQGADVVIVSDNDPQARDKKTGALQFHADGRPKLPGQDHAAALAQHMRKVAAHVRVMIFPQKDLTAWREADGTKAALEALIDSAPDYEGPAPPPPEPGAVGDEPPAKGKRAKNRDQPGWLARCLVDEKGRIVANLANALIALRADPSFEGVLAFDEMAQSTMLMRPLPLAPSARPAGNGPIPRQACDEDFNQVQEWLQHQGLPRISRETVYQAVGQRAREWRFHPLREYLDRVEWDGTERLSSAFKTYFGATGKEEYLTAVSRMFFISMVARIFDPGCKCDHMVVLEGDQGAHKSRACLALATAPFFSDCLSNIQGKDARQHLRGKWLIEISELAAISKAETETLKAFITRTVEKYRPPYGHEDVAEPRQCVFIGSTNRETYLKDETGGRRFWPVRTGVFDIAALERDRDQLFAEAVDRFRHGEQWWPDPAFERLHIKPEQDDRYEGDPWEGPVAEYVAGLSETYVLTIARNALSFDVTAKIGTKDQHRIVAILTKLGWRRGKHNERGNPYVRG